MNTGPAASEYVTDFFTYSNTPVTVPALQQVTSQIIINADADFAIEKLTAFHDGINVALPVDLQVMLTDSGSGRQLLSTSVPLFALFGSAYQPFIMPAPKVLSARSTLSITLTNMTAAPITNVQLCFIGRKLFLS